MNDEDELFDVGLLSYADNESVCGEDTRYKITETNTVPYYYACFLSIRFPQGRFVGSAFPIIKNDKYVVLATSGHCVYAMNQFATEITVTPALNENKKPYGTFKVASENLRASTKWQEGGLGRDQHDYGAILLPADAGIPIFPFVNMSDEELQNRVINNCGYPGDKNRIEPGTLWWGGGPLSKVEPRMLRYMLDTAGGQSGSAVYTWCDDSILRAIGIHGYGGCPNGAVRFTQDVIDDFNAWAES